jgi:hypothetical protein
VIGGFVSAMLVNAGDWSKTISLVGGMALGHRDDGR